MIKAVNSLNENKSKEYAHSFQELSLAKVKEVISKTLSSNESLIEHVIGRLYIAYDSSPQFEYTQLEGIVCLVFDRKSSVLLLQIYDMLDINKEFEIELYKNIAQGYHVISDTYHSIEYPSFFLGLNFPKESFAKQFQDTLFVHSSILNAKPNQFVYHLEAEDDEERKVKVGHIEDLVLFHYNKESGELIYNISKESTNYLERMGVDVAKMNTDYENLRGEFRFKKFEGTEKKGEESEDIEDKVDSLIYLHDDKGDEGEGEDFSLENKVNRKVRANKVSRITFQTESEERYYQIKNKAEWDPKKKSDYPRRRTENTNFDALKITIPTLLDKIEKEEKVLTSISQENSD